MIKRRSRRSSAGRRMVGKTAWRVSKVDFEWEEIERGLEDAC